MKKILGLTVAALLVMGLVGGGTWAYFTDVETSTGNVFTAGTLNLVPDTAGSGSCTVDVIAGGDGINGNVAFSLVKPGDTGIITWTLYNDGTLPGTLKVASDFTFGLGDEPEPETNVVANDLTDGDLDDFVGVKFQRGAGTDAASATTALATGYLLGDAGTYAKLSLLEAALDDATGQAMAAIDGGDDYIIYKLSWSVADDIYTFEATPADVDDNIIQGDTATINVTFTLEQ